MSHDSERPFAQLTFDTSADRLRASCRLGGVVLLASALLPFEVVGTQQVFVWQILSELHPATAVAALSPALAGLAVLAASRWVKRPSALALLTLLALATWSLVTTLGADAAAWDFAALPDSLDRRLELYAITIALAGAAIRLLAEPAAGRAARVAALVSVSSGLAFGVWPARGEAPLETCARFLRDVWALPDVRLVLGYGLLLVIGCFPLLAAGAAASLALAGRGRHTALAAELVTFGAPGLLLLLALRNVLLTFGDASVVVLGGIALVLGAVLALAARSLELLALFAAGLARDSSREPAGRPWRTLAVASAPALLLVAAVFVLSRPVSKGIEWKLARPSPAADQLFGELVPRWALARARWGVAARRTGSAAELAEARAAGNEVVRTARALDPELGRALGALVHEAKELDVAGRRWFRLIEDVNEASRRSGLPYYLDPGVSGGTVDGDLQRLFVVYPHRVEAVQPARADELTYALLAVRRLGDARSSHQRLGFSRDFQPFALVVLDEIEPYADLLGELARQEPPTCVEGAADPLFARCGELLRGLRPTSDGVRRLVERHELQHQIDGPALTRSAAVLEALSGYDDAAIDEVNRELSAYVAELVADGVSPKLGLVHTLPFLAAKRGSALSFVVRLQLSALSRRELDALIEAELTVVFSELASLSDADLRARAHAAYEELFDQQLPEVRAQP